MTTSCSTILAVSRVVRFPLLCLWAAVLLACESGRRDEALHFSGSTMGTTYNVTVVHGPETPVPDGLAESIQGWMDAVDQRMSTYKSDSELSQLNRAPVGEWLTISPMMAEVLTVAQEVGEASGGAFDITVAPLVDLWGFGPADTDDQVPEDSVLAQVQQRVGLEHLQLRADPPAIRKTRDLQLDLSAVAKGFGADYVGRELKALDLGRSLVEIGGDLSVSGLNAEGEPWRIGVESPSFERQGVQQAIAVTDSGIATSGDYRNFFQQDGQTYTHILDPRLGRPVQRNVVSVTAVTDSAALADAWATAFSVMGAEESLALSAEEELGLYLIIKADEGFITRHSEAFAAYMTAE